MLGLFFFADLGHFVISWVNIGLIWSIWASLWLFGPSYAISVNLGHFSHIFVDIFGCFMAAIFKLFQAILGRFWSLQPFF